MKRIAISADTHGLLRPASIRPGDYLFIDIERAGKIAELVRRLKICVIQNGEQFHNIYRVRSHIIAEPVADGFAADESKYHRTIQNGQGKAGKSGLALSLLYADEPLDDAGRAF